MKTLTNYINEGLIADIILKLVDASLSWLGGASKFVGEKLAGATKELWDTGKNLGDKFWKQYNSVYGTNYGRPRNEAEFTKRIFNDILSERDPRKRKEKLDRLRDLGVDPEFIYAAYMMDAFTTISDPNASKADKKAANKTLDKIRTECPSLKQEIDNFRRELNNRNNNQNN
jgi:hypothetical protein